MKIKKPTLTFRFFPCPKCGTHYLSRYDRNKCKCSRPERRKS